ncbi:hypothetical protein AMTR_s00020p00232390 [Amborella trichopoda]|uniref:Uncharacterized protein n=1 Tax=Amborella trichopoda TaxID=13333 RepID=W1PWZ4_AMBTC|nr:hypothetical protein AMTR_s00020p00232390 [Amborella trichopoda]
MEESNKAERSSVFMVISHPEYYHVLFELYARLSHPKPWPYTQYEAPQRHMRPLLHVLLIGFWVAYDKDLSAIKEALKLSYLGFACNGCLCLPTFGFSLLKAAEEDFELFQRDPIHIRVYLEVLRWGRWGIERMGWKLMDVIHWWVEVGEIANGDRVREGGQVIVESSTCSEASTSEQQRDGNDEGCSSTCSEESPPIG